MFMFKVVKVREFEKGIMFRDGEFQRILSKGKYYFFDPLNKLRVDIVSTRAARFAHSELDVIARSGALEGLARVLDLTDKERALVWVDGRFTGVLEPGLYAYWTTFRNVRFEIIDALDVRFEHKELASILKSSSVNTALDKLCVEVGFEGLYFLNGKFISRLSPGTYAFWRNVGVAKFDIIDMRERVLDISGQELMTSDKVSLRLNAVVTFRVNDSLKATTDVEDVSQSVYRQTQLALRAVIGTLELDKFLGTKDAVVTQLEEIVRQKTLELGIKILSLGIKDVILPGEMKLLMNKVTEAKKAAEADLITRREETAAMRSQANTAKILDSNPTLMRLKELEVIEKLTGKADLSVILGEKKLQETLTKLI